jgi:putative tricarboxylic transport membrane protein
MNALPQREPPVARVRDEDPEQKPARRSLRSRLLAGAPYLVTLAAAVLLLIKANEFDFDHVPGRIGPDAWPKLVLSLMIVAGGWGVLKAVLFEDGSNATDQGSSLPTSAISPQDPAYLDEAEIYPARVWAVLAGTIAYLWILHYLGFFLGTSAFLAFVIYVGGYRKPVRLLFIAVIGSVFFMTIFVRVVYVSLPLGIEPFSTVSSALLAVLNR